MDLAPELILNKLEQISEALHNQGEVLRTLTAKMDSMHRTPHVPSSDASRSIAEPSSGVGNRPTFVTDGGQHSETNLDVTPTLAAKGTRMHFMPLSDESRNVAEFRLRAGTQANPGGLPSKPLKGADMQAQHSETNVDATPRSLIHFMPLSDESRNVAEFRLRAATHANSGSQSCCDHANSGSQSSLESANTESRPEPLALEQNLWRVEINDDGLPKIVHVSAGSMQFQDSRLRKFLWNLGFDGFWIGIIVLNALVMGALLHTQAKREVYDPKSMVYVDLVFSGLFVLEYILRLVRKGMSHYFCGSSTYWTAYDTFILLISIIDTFLYAFGVWSATSLSISVFRLVRILRLADVVRGVRVLRNLRLLIVGVIDSILAVTWTVGILAGVMYIGSVIVMTNVIEDVVDGEEYYVKNWGGIPTSMCTLFQVMTGDAWWTEVVAGIRDEYPYMPYMFIAYYCVTAFGLLNIVTAIFVENTLSAATKDVELLRDKREMAAKTLKAFFKDLFKLIDRNGDGVVDYEEFELSARSPQIAFAMGQSDLKTDDVLKLFLLLDTSSTGVIRRDDFVKGCMMLRGQPTIADIFEHGVNSKRMLAALREEVDLCNETLSRIMGHLMRSDEEWSI